MPLSFRKDIILGGTTIGSYYESASGLISGRGLDPSFGPFASLADMVSIYKTYFSETHRRSNTKCGIGASVLGTNEDIDIITNELVYIVPNGHQKRHHDISFPDLNTAQTIIDATPISSYPSFFDGPDGLYEFVNNLIGGIRNVGPLTVYDTAIRIGQNLTPIVEPLDFVYIPASGPLDGARKFFSSFLRMPSPPIVSGPSRIAIRHFGILTSAPFSLLHLRLKIYYVYFTSIFNHEQHY